MYASSSIELIFNVKPEMMVGKPFLLYIRSDDLASFVEQADMAKSSSVITRMRFWFQSPHLAEETPCDGIVFGSADGMVVILRRCNPFVRKRLIQNSGLFASRAEEEQSPVYGVSTSLPKSFMTTQGGARRTTRGTTRSSPYNMSPSEELRAPMNWSPTTHYSSLPTTTTCSSSPATSTLTASPPIASTILQPPPGLTQAAVEGTRWIDCPLRNLPRQNINFIRDLDREQESVQPIAMALTTTMTITEEENEITKTERWIRQVHIQDVGEETDDLPHEL